MVYGENIVGIIGPDSSAEHEIHPGSVMAQHPPVEFQPRTSTQRAFAVEDKAVHATSISFRLAEILRSIYPYRLPYPETTFFQAPAKFGTLVAVQLGGGKTVTADIIDDLVLIFVDKHS